MNTSLIQGVKCLMMSAKPGEQIRKVVIPPKLDPVAVLITGKPTEIRLPGPIISSPILTVDPAVDLCFRPMSGQMPPPREIAIALGANSTEVKRFDLYTLGAIAGFNFSDASAVAYSQDGLMLAAGGNKGLVRVWSLQNDLELLYEFQVGKRSITKLMFDSSNKRLFVINHEGDLFNMRLADSVVPEPVLRDPEDHSLAFDWECLTMAAHSSRQRVAFGGYGKMVYLVDYDQQDNNAKVTSLSIDGSSVTSHISFLGTGDQLCVVGTTGVQIWDLATSLPISVWNPPEGTRVIAINQHGNILYASLIKRTPLSS